MNSTLPQFPVGIEDRDVLSKLMEEYIQIVEHPELLSDFSGEEAEGVDRHVEIVPGHILKQLKTTRENIREAQALKRTIGQDCITTEVRSGWIDKLTEMESKFSKMDQSKLPKRKLEQIRSWKNFFEEKNANLPVCPDDGTLPHPNYKMFDKYGKE